MVRRLGLGKNNHLSYASLALNPRYIIFTADGSFSKTQQTSSGQAQKAIFKSNGYLYKFTNMC